MTHVPPKGTQLDMQGLVIAGRCRGTFERCVISDCRSAGIRLRNDARPVLRGNLVVGCQGPGMVVAGSLNILCDKSGVPLNNKM
jgi:parallel beta-helix repeat protein